MAEYSRYPKLGKVQLPTPPGQQDPPIYALYDYDGRAMLTSTFSESATYNIGAYVIYQDDLYKAKVYVPAGTWDATKWDKVTVGSELKRIEGLTVGGIHWRGKTKTAIYDGSSNPNIILVQGSQSASFTASEGDMVMLDISYLIEDASYAYTANVAINANAYVVHDDILYFNGGATIPQSENTKWDDVSDKLGIIKTNPEFIFGNGVWNNIGAIDDGLGDLAFKDTASGTYDKAIGGAVTLFKYTPTKKQLAITSITGTDGTVDASKVSVKTTQAFALRNATPNTVAVADSETTKIGNADVGESVSVGSSLTGTKTFNTNAIKSASLTGTKTFSTNAIKSATIDGTNEFTVEGLTANVVGDCLTFSNATTGTFSIDTESADTGTVGISTTPADTGTVGLGMTSITPAVAVSASSATIRGVSGTVDIYGTSGTADAITALNITAVTPAKVAPTATTVATGATTTATTGVGDTVVTNVQEGTGQMTVSIATEPTNVTVR